MDIRNRMADVVKLRCNACQDLLKMIICEDWQQKLYTKAKNEVDNNSRFKDKYIAAYEKMRDIGIENYRIEDMDVTFISEIVHGCKHIANVTDKTRKSIEQLTEDRNLANHSNENEEPEELYLRGLLALCNVRSFIKTVDKFESDIDDAEKLSYRNTYMKRVTELMELLDQERISLIQNAKDMDRDIQKILSSEDRLKTWCDVIKIYMDRSFKVDHDVEKYQEFILRASDAGITRAHGQAADYYLNKVKDCDKAERRMRLLIEDRENLSLGDAQSITQSISTYMIRGNKLTIGLEEIVASLIERGFPIEKNSTGMYVMISKRKKA